MRKSLLRLGLSVVGAAGIAAGTMAGPLTAHSAGSVTLTPANVPGSPGGGFCHNLNPDLELNTSALTAVADNTRGWSQFAQAGVTVAGGPTITGLDGSAIPEAAITVNLCAPVPAFPAANGDTGAEYYVCFSPDPSEQIESGRYGNQGVGFDPITGSPAFDGPYPESQGYRLCAWASVNTAGGVDSGVAYYDPIGLFTFLDTVNNKTPVTATTLATGATSFTMYLPYVWQQLVNIGLPNQFVESSQVMKVGDTAKDFAAESEVAFNVGLPFPVCVPTNPATCEQGILGELVPVDTAPGYEQCTSVAQGCQQYGPLGFDFGIENNFPVSSIPTCVTPNPPGNNPLSPNLGCDVATFPNTPVTGGIAPHPSAAGAQLPYITIFTYGRVMPGAMVPFEGFSYQLFGDWQATGLNFAA